MACNLSHHPSRKRDGELAGDAAAEMQLFIANWFCDIRCRGKKHNCSIVEGRQNINVTRSARKLTAGDL